MKRGDLVTVTVAGDYGKPRPAVIVQSDALNSIESVLVALVTSHRLDAPLYRLPCPAGSESGLREPSDIQIEKIIALPRSKVGKPIGHLGEEDMLTLNRMLAFVLGIAESR